MQDINWELFEKWLAKDKTQDVVKDILRYAKKYHYCLNKGDLTPIAMLSVAKRRLVMASLSNLAKFLGIYDYWKALVHKYGIKWITMETRDKRIIDRITRVVDPDDIYHWIKEVKENVPKYAELLDLIAITGMRLKEAIASYNLIIKLYREGKLNSYYNEANQCLEHYKFKELFLRKGKKVFISFVPKELVYKITQKKPIETRFLLKHKVKKERFSDIREAHATLLTRHLTQPEIDFLHGRIGINVFMQNYFNPKVISDLQERIFKAITEIRSKI